MLAMSDRQGRIWASVPGLAGRARVQVDACRTALECFLAPDPDSRTKEFEGRRIEEMDGGWRLLNHAKYREMRDTEVRKDYQRKWVSTKRRRSKNVDKNVEKAVDCRPVSTYAEAEADAEADKNVGVLNSSPSDLYVSSSSLPLRESDVLKKRLEEKGDSVRTLLETLTAAKKV